MVVGEIYNITRRPNTGISVSNHLIEYSSLILQQLTLIMQHFKSFEERYCNTCEKLNLCHSSGPIGIFLDLIPLLKCIWAKSPHNFGYFLIISFELAYNEKNVLEVMLFKVATSMFMVKADSAEHPR